jgi:hypothetical protein
MLVEMQKATRQATVTINTRLTREATKAGVDLKMVVESAIKRAIAKKELLKKANKLFKNSTLTEADAIRLGRKVNAAIARRLAI